MALGSKIPEDTLLNGSQSPVQPTAILESVLNKRTTFHLDLGDFTRALPLCSPSQPPSLYSAPEIAVIAFILIERIYAGRVPFNSVEK